MFFLRFSDRPSYAHQIANYFQSYKVLRSPYSTDKIFTRVLSVFLFAISLTVNRWTSTCSVTNPAYRNVPVSLILVPVNTRGSSHLSSSHLSQVLHIYTYIYIYIYLACDIFIAIRREKNQSQRTNHND